MAYAKRPRLHREEAWARRLDAVNFARRSARLEGFVLSEQIEAISRRYVDGQLSEEEFIHAIQEVAGVTTR